MRQSNFLLLLASLFIVACSNPVLANTRVVANRVEEDGGYKRLLRASTKTDVQDDDDDEDRAFNLRLPTWFRLWRLRQVAGKVKTTDVISAKESAWIDRWVAKDLSPDYLYKKLGLAKQGDKAMQSQNYRLFEEYNNRLFAKDQALYQSWMEKLMTPEDVYKALKLDKLKGAKAAKSKDFRRYEVYLFKYYETK